MTTDERIAALEQRVRDLEQQLARVLDTEQRDGPVVVKAHVLMVMDADGNARVVTMAGPDGSVVTQYMNGEQKMRTGIGVGPGRQASILLLGSDLQPKVVIQEGGDHQPAIALVDDRGAKRVDLTLDEDGSSFLAMLEPSGRAKVLVGAPSDEEGFVQTSK